MNQNQNNNENKVREQKTSNYDDFDSMLKGFE